MLGTRINAAMVVFSGVLFVLVTRRLPVLSVLQSLFPFRSVLGSFHCKTHIVLLICLRLPNTN